MARDRDKRKREKRKRERDRQLVSCDAGLLSVDLIKTLME